MHIPRAICMFCKMEMRVKQNSVIVEMRIPREDEPYYKISCDIHQCRNCQREVALPAQAPIATAYERDKYDSIPAGTVAYFVN